jgi:hypothetical protein
MPFTWPSGAIVADLAVQHPAEFPEIFSGLSEREIANIRSSWTHKRDQDFTTIFNFLIGLGFGALTVGVGGPLAGSGFMIGTSALRHLLPRDPGLDAFILGQSLGVIGGGVALLRASQVPSQLAAVGTSTVVGVSTPTLVNVVSPLLGTLVAVSSSAAAAVGGGTAVLLALSTIASGSAGLIDVLTGFSRKYGKDAYFRSEFMD